MCDWFVNGGERRCDNAFTSSERPSWGNVLSLCTQHEKTLENWMLYGGPPQYVEPERWMYFIHNRFTNLVKIGHGVDPERRIRDLQTQGGVRYEVLGIIRETEALNEGVAHWMASRDRKIGEWFETSEELFTWINQCLDWATQLDLNRV